MKSRKKLSAVARKRMFVGRSNFAVALMAVGAFLLIGRAVHLQVLDQGFLSDQADARQLRSVELSAHRGSITDRNGEPLAVSTPVDSVWVDPREMVDAPENIAVLAKLLKRDEQTLRDLLSNNAKKGFLYLKRHMNPSDARLVARYELPGVYIEREYRRFYPAAHVTGHLIGFANIDDVGQEGVELAFDHRLAGQPGKKLVLKDRLGRSVEDIKRVKAPVPGHNIATSIDLRIQYLAYTELKKAVQAHGAKSGSAVVIDVHTGEVLAMVNQPEFNPNDRAQLKPELYRNRAITDRFEPGSSLKPLILAAALESGDYKVGSSVDTNPGYLQVGSKRIKDKHNLGRIDLATVLARSSNVGSSMIAMSLKPKHLWQVLTDFGLGKTTASGFPGESAGSLSDFVNWRPISQATLAYGYGLSVTPLQLAQAYAVMGAGGVRRPVSLLKVTQPAIPHRVLSANTAKELVTMMEGVVSADGTGIRASVSGYRVAGKTGTTQKFSKDGYSSDRYTAIFAGLAPATNPRLAVVVVIDEPTKDEYYGGVVSAPVFSKIVAHSARILAIPPDDLRDVHGSSITVALRE